ncbi:MAG: hypothetical protein Q4C03_04245 [bacterium]|nr:hypothetical protein [bacterium]
MRRTIDKEKLKSEIKARGISLAEASRRIYANDNYFYMLFHKSSSNKISDVKVKSIEANLGIPYEAFKDGADEIPSVYVIDEEVRKVIESPQFEEAVRTVVLKVLKEVMGYGF